MTRSSPLLAIVLLCACGGPPETAGADAGVDEAAPTQSDAGDERSDLDAGAAAPEPDAGPDGTPDAGRPASDAGADDDPPDAGVAPVEPEPDPGPSCGPFPSATDLEGDGPLAVTELSAGPSCTVFRPSTLPVGARYPIVVWGNGTAAPVSVYASALEYWASYGFLVIAANATDGQGSGEPQLDCLDWLLEQDETAGALFEGHVCPRVGVSGHSQGGAGALMVGMDPRVTVTAPVQPYTQQGWGDYETASIAAQSASPMLLLSGTADSNAVPSVYQQPVFDDANVPVFWANRVGADHYFSALGLSDYRTTLLQWFRLQLMDDESFRDVFYGVDCALCEDSDWIVERTSGF